MNAKTVLSPISLTCSPRDYTQSQIEPEMWNQKAERSLFREKVSTQINDTLITHRANILKA